MPGGAFLSFLLAVAFGLVAVALFVGPTPLYQLVATAEQAVEGGAAKIRQTLAWAGGGTSKQQKVNYKYDQEIARTRTKLKTMEAERARLESRVAELEKVKAKEDWASLFVSNASNIVSALSAVLSGFFGWLTYRLQKKAPR
jgi:hypothetical protein